MSGIDREHKHSKGNRALAIVRQEKEHPFEFLWAQVPEGRVDAIEKEGAFHKMFNAVYGCWRIAK